jgi:L-ascorbate metabolism protein UlaG (beta-lactamase superfamily)
MVEIKYLYHSFFQISFDGCKILIDPFINSKAPSETNGMGQKLIKCPAKEKDFRNINIILITHEHFDHFDKQAIEKIATTNNATVITHEFLLQQLNIPGFLKRPIHANMRFNCHGVQIAAVPVHHPQAFYPLGFVLEKQGTKIFHTGDTDLMQSFSELKADIFLVPIGGKITMDSVDAVRAVKIMKPRYAIPMHYNTFPLIKASPQEFKSKIEDSVLKTETVIMKPGQRKKFS